MSIANKISAKNRARKFDIFKQNIYFDEKINILDVGFNDTEYSNVDNYLEKNYPYQQNITALGIGSKENFIKKYPKVNAVLYDGTTFPFPDKTFDICWSNAVIEHVGDFEKQLFFLCEMNRVAKKVFFTTPNKYFPVEVHTRTPFLHIISKNLFEKYLIFIGKKWATGNYMNLLSKKLLIKLLQNAKIENFRIISNKLLGFTLDFVIIINP